MMRIVRIVVLVAFLLVSAVFVKTYISNEKKKDNTYPVIKLETDTIHVSTDVKSEKLLEGVSAYDEKDGDLTEKVIVESISKFFNLGECKITYAVCDSDSHVTSITRKLIYDSYVSPRFVLDEPLIFTVGSRVNLSDIVGATDLIDGDISNNVIVTSNDYQSGQVGVFHADMKVSNSKGDIVVLRAPMHVIERVVQAPQITLKKNIVYTTLGKKLDLESFVEGITDSNGEPLSLDVKIRSEIKYKEEGAYSVHYLVTDSEGRQGHTVLTVVVEA